MAIIARSLGCFGLAAALVLGTQAARADTIAYSDSLPLTPTDFTQPLSVPRFDPALGTLDRVTVTLTGRVEGSHRFESLDPMPVNVTMTHHAVIALRRPDLTALVASMPDVSSTTATTAFDGGIDFAGGSGRTLSSLMSESANSVTLLPAGGELVLFTGPGDVVLPVTAVATGMGSGSGNLITQFSTSASAHIVVAYDFTPAATSAPEPSTLVLLGVGIGGLLMAWQAGRFRARPA